jgi:hypothetical protein
LLISLPVTLLHLFIKDGQFVSSYLDRNVLCVYAIEIHFDAFVIRLMNKPVETMAV